MHQKAFIVSGLLLVAVATLIALRGSPMMTAPGTSVAGRPVSFTELVHGTYSNVSNRTNYLITSGEQLSALWRIIDVSVEKPTIDFSTQTVVAVFTGTVPTLGHAIAVTRVEDGEKRLVTITLSKPGGSCVAGEAVTQPYQVISVPKTDLVFDHKDLVKTVSCFP